MVLYIFNYIIINWSPRQIDVWLAADGHIELVADDGEKYTLSTAHQDVSAYVQLTDDWLHQTILHSRDPKLKPAKVSPKCIERIVWTFCLCVPPLSNPALHFAISSAFNPEKHSLTRINRSLRLTPDVQVGLLPRLLNFHAPECQRHPF